MLCTRSARRLTLERSTPPTSTPCVLGGPPWQVRQLMKDRMAMQARRGNSMEVIEKGVKIREQVRARVRSLRVPGPLFRVCARSKFHIRNTTSARHVSESRAQMH